MAGDAHGGRPAAPGSILPPVFTRWSEPAAEKGGAAPEARDVASGPGATPPFLDPMGGQPSAPSPAPAAPAPDEEDSFPIEAFIIPEEAERLPSGVDSVPSANTTPLSKKLMQPLPEDRTARLADRLESIARRLRTDGPAALDQDLQSPNRFDALLAGVLAGYLASGDD